jgi:glycosyltransferase involved in cell wall biosynthesis
MRSLPGGTREVMPNLHVCAPLVLPPFGSKTRKLLNRRILLPLIRRAVKKLGFTAEVIITYLPTDTVTALISLLREPGGLTVYYCIADFAELTPHVKEMLASESEVVEMSNVVFAQCEQLAARCSRDGKQVGIFPFGVNLELFTTSNQFDTSTASLLEPEANISSIASLPRPVIGYVGGIHRHFDTCLLSTMAQSRPDWSWVLIGRVETPLNGLKQIPNVHFFGPKAHRELPHYINDFDVAIVPYVHNEYTTTVVPTKINEYLAMGKPVVSTDLPEVNAFNKLHNVIITTPNQPAEFLSSIERALLLPKEDGLATQRRAVAALNDWKRRVERMSNLIEVSTTSR